MKDLTGVRVLSFHWESSCFHNSFFSIYNTHLSYFSVMHFFKITKLKVVFCVISYRNNVFLSFLPKMPGIGPQMEGQDPIRKVESRTPQEHYLQPLLCFCPLGGPTYSILLPHPHSSFGPGLPPQHRYPWRLRPLQGCVPCSKMASGASALGEVSSLYSGREGGERAGGG